MQIHSKLPKMGSTIFTTMTQLALKNNAINLGQGFPDFMMSEELISLVNESMKKGHNQYCHMNGLALLRERIAEKAEKLYQCKLNPELETTITPGATYAIYTALTTILSANDEVIYFEPAYDSYLPAIKLNGAIPVPIELNAPDFNIPWELVRASVNKNTKAIIINTPHNPTGYVWTKNDIESLKSIVENTDIIIISDEVYEHLIFEDKVHESILKYPELYSRSYVCFSFGKTYHCTGWKLGYIISPEYLSNEFRSIHQYNAFCSDAPKQYAFAEYMLNANAYLQLGKQIQEKRDYFASLMKDTPFERVPSYGTYFECYSYKSISKLDEFDYAKELVEKHRVASIPVSSFYSSKKNQHLLRFCFAKKEETLTEAVNRLKNI